MIFIGIILFFSGFSNQESLNVYYMGRYHEFSTSTGQNIMDRKVMDSIEDGVGAALDGKGTFDKIVEFFWGLK